MSGECGCGIPNLLIYLLKRTKRTKLSIDNFTGSSMTINNLN
jgi:hypothetical protein